MATDTPTKRPRRQPTPDVLGAELASLTNAERVALADYTALTASDADHLGELAATIRSMMVRLNVATSPCASCGHEHYERRGDFLKHQMLEAAASRLDRVAEELRDEAYRARPVLERER